ncbi:Heparan-alpha-glucosaminide N-acetyltransferase [Arachis hypogaea]|nr:Heparan-alpha-glucosaminide N-acetyltransferase [Arachis hypogaea]
MDKRQEEVVKNDINDSTTEHGKERIIMEVIGVKQKTKRVATLDAFRGLTIVLMILVDDAGGAYPRIDHSPWDGCTLADFVMPFFLFIVGVAIALALKVTLLIHHSLLVFSRGYSHAPDDLVYGVNIKFIRWCGILQRIALIYCIVALIETFTTKLRPTTFTPGHLSIFTAYKWQWFGGLVAFLIYMITTYTLYVSDWSFVDHIDDDKPLKRYTVICGMRGHLGPACNAVGYVDRHVWGVNHLYSQPVWRRLKVLLHRVQRHPGPCHADPADVAFPTYLDGAALLWFSKLPAGSSLLSKSWRSLSLILRRSKNIRPWIGLPRHDPPRSTGEPKGLPDQVCRGDYGNTRPRSAVHLHALKAGLRPGKFRERSPSQPKTLEEFRERAAGQMESKNYARPTKRKGNHKGGGTIMRSTHNKEIGKTFKLTPKFDNYTRFNTRGKR